MDRDWIRPKKNTAGIVFIILALLFFAAAGWLIYEGMAADAQAEKMAAADYSANRVFAQKGMQADPPGISISQQLPENASDNTYVTPLGFPIISHSEIWKGSKLKEIYEELIKNEHGDEIYKISSVMIFPGAPESGGNELAIAGTHVTEFVQYPVFFHLPGVLPASMEYKIFTRKSIINLYNMDNYDSVIKAARTISHEYGHHFTMYHFMQNDTAARESEYYRLREIDSFGRDVFFEKDEDYYANHMWSIYELAAEDYVQLLGSPNAKQTREYMDIYDMMYSNKEEYKASWNTALYNIYPQENSRLSLADDVPGLRDYFYSFIGKENTYKTQKAFDFKITMNKKSAYGGIYYEITWDKPTNDRDALYTLVCYDKDWNVFLPVRTIKGNQRAIARVGKVIRKIENENGTTMKYPEESKFTQITQEDRIFRLYVLWPDGRMQSSKPFNAHF